MERVKIIVLSLWHAFLDIITWNFAARSTAAKRLSICEPCEARKDSRCTICGCYLPAKVNLKNSECPMELWGPE